MSLCYGESIIEIEFFLKDDVMNFIDIWSIVAGLASIVSLFLVMKDRLPKWRRFISPAGYILAGFAIGRISVALLPGATGSIHGIRFMGFFLVLLAFFGILFLIFLSMIKKIPDWHGALIIIVVIYLTIPHLLNGYNKAFPDVPREDYLILANIKEEKSDIAGAIRYLERYRSMLSDNKIIKQVDERIKKLQDNQFSSE